MIPSHVLHRLINFDLSTLDLPENPTQRDYILAYLKTGRVLTRQRSVFLFDFLEAPARITELKQKGYPIKTVRVKVDTKTERAASIAIWYLDIHAYEKMKSMGVAA